MKIRGSKEFRIDLIFEAKEKHDEAKTNLSREIRLISQHRLHKS